MAAVFLVSRKWRRRGHGGTSLEVDYSIYLNGVRLRGFSTHGNMTEGYWGSSAKSIAVGYAESVARTLGVRYFRVRHKDSE